MTGWYVTANDIRQWTETNKRRSEEILPLLVKKLILASCKPVNIDFPSGDSVSIGGWDGILEVDKGNDFIPSGKSGWEFGTNSAVKKKADDDFSKRTKKPAPLILSETTFVFVTTRLWTKRDGWARSKELNNKWKNVKGLNAESLADWLETCPAVHRWFSEMLGKRFPTIWDIDQAWNEFSNKTAVKLTHEFLLYGRKVEAGSLVDSLVAGETCVHRVKAESKIEAYGFLLSALSNDERAKSRCLIIKSQKSWDAMITSEQSLILIPEGFHPTGMGAAVSNNHYIILAVNKYDKLKCLVNLSRQPRIERTKSMEILGFSEEDARVLYQKTKGYFEPILRHSMLKPIDYIEPCWPSEIESEVLITVLFISEWEEHNENDRKIIETMSGLSYVDFQKKLNVLSAVGDSPIRLVGEVWQVVSKIDFWLLVSSKISNSSIDNLKEVVSKIFSDLDPSYELPPEDRYLASIRGIVPKYSERLKKGVADSLAFLSVYGDEACEGLSQKFVSSLVKNWIRQVFENNNDAKFWFSLGACTELLAEAAPGEFIYAIESSMRGKNSAILGLFKAEGSGAFGGRCYQANILWALELISWDKQYLAKVSMCLARLSEIDPGGNSGNKPFNSLVDIYLGWINNSSATHQERLKIIKNVLIVKYPKIAWRLMTRLLQNNHSYTFGIHHPEYKEWPKDIGKKVNVNSYFEYIEKIVDLLLQELDTDTVYRSIDLIGKLDSFTQIQRGVFLDKLASIETHKIEAKFRIKILDKLRKIISHHREFSQANWAWPEGLIDKLEMVYDNFNFSDLIESNIFMFNDNWPDLIDTAIGAEEKNKEIAKQRILIIESIYDEQSDKGLEILVEKCLHPNLVGGAASKSSSMEQIKVLAVSWLGQEGKKEEFSIGYFTLLYSSNVSNALLFLKSHNSWSPIKQAKFLLCLPLTTELIDFVLTLPAEGKSYYWSKINTFIVHDKNVETALKFTRMLIDNDRPLGAITALGWVLRNKNESGLVDTSLVVNVLKCIASDPSDIDRIHPSSANWDILEAIGFLQDSGNVSEEDVIGIEWLYLDQLRDGELSPKHIIKSTSEDPRFFAKLVVWSYKKAESKSMQISELSEKQIINRSKSSMKLLDLIHTLPGEKGNIINVGILSKWVSDVRRYLSGEDLAEIGDEIIGKLLACCPKGEDGIWPHESVRLVIEECDSNSLDNGIVTGRMSPRGVTCRELYAGGSQERKMANQYSLEAEGFQFDSPRVASILKTIGEYYESRAHREDEMAELRS